MSPNKKLIETYLATADRAQAAPLLDEEVEWGDGVPATGVRTRGRAAFLQNFGTDELRCEITRLTEENNVVVAEGIAHVHKKDGHDLRVRFCNLFEVENAKIKRLSSYGALLQDSG